jgi:uncharacterized OsmC-like protein
MVDAPLTQHAPDTVAPPPTPRERVRAAFARRVRLLSARPASGRGTAVTCARLDPALGLACEVAEGDWRVTIDLSPNAGGAGLGANPGMLGRGALASCLAIGYALWAAHAGITLDSIHVEVQADYDSGAMFGVGEATPGYRRVRYTVSVTSEAPEPVVRQVLDQAERHSPYYAVFSRPHALERVLRVERPER